MLSGPLYLLLIALVVALLIWINIYLITLIYSWIKGAPYVSTNTSQIIKILGEIQMEKGSSFLELGCGDGRVVREAVRRYQAVGLGVEINPYLVWLARLRAKLSGLNNIRFIRANIFDYSFSSYPDFIYIFLFPVMIERLGAKLLKQMRRGATVISHGFKVTHLDEHLIKVVDSGKFKTYIYREK